MPPKADKLQQNLHELQSFLRRKIEQHSELESLIGNLKKFEGILAEKKLTLQIVSENEFLSQAIFDLINTNPNFANSYHIKYDAIPKPPRQFEPQIITQLTLERIIGESPEIEQEYNLYTNQKYLIGRSPDCDINLDESIYNGISWQHAKIESLINSNNEIQWQITDLKSSNGTYINGEKLENNSHILQSNDKITLGSKKIKKAIAQLKFHTEIKQENSDIDEPYWDIIDSDLLLLIIDGKQALSEQEEWFIKELDCTYFAKQFLIINIPDEGENKDINVDEMIANIDHWLEEQSLSSKFELFPLYLKPYYDEEKSKELTKLLQKKQDKFMKGIDNLVKRQPENILAKRLAIHISKILEPVELILKEDATEIQGKIKEYKEDLDELTKVNWKNITKESLTKVKEDKDKFFKQLKLDLSQAKSSILDNFSKLSIIYKIQSFTDDLKPVEIKRRSHYYIIMSKSDSVQDTNINEVLIQFSISCIEDWAIKEWDKINNYYNNGGLKNLLNNAYHSINIVPSLLEEKNPFAPPESLNLEANFQIPFAGIECEERHKKVSLAVYIMKTIRSNLMQIMMMTTMTLGFVGVRAGKNDLIAKISGIFQAQPWLLGIIIFALVFFLVSSYHDDNDLKVEETAEKLKKQITSYYQSFSKSLIDKVIQDINLALEYEATRIDNVLKNMEELYQDYIVEVEKKQIKIQVKMDEYKEKDKNITKELAEFKKLKKL